MIKVILSSALALLALVYQPEKPKILIIGDSISIGYTPFVKEAMKDKAEVLHNAGNARYSGNGVDKIESWIGDTRWDIIQFNWGLWDLAYRLPSDNSAGTLDKVNGKLTTTPEQYKKNLEDLVGVLKKTGAKLIFVTTTYVPKEEPGRSPDDVKKYNAIAKEVMKKNGIMINDLNKPSKKIHHQHGLGADNVHYSKDGYKALSNHVVKGLEEALKK